jgi:hypothetical protein
MSQLPVSSVYQQNIEQLENLLSALKRKQSQFGWLRLSIVLAVSIIAYFIFAAYGPWGWLVVGAGIVTFLILVSIDTVNNARILHTNNLLAINKDELSVLNNNYQHLYNGEGFQPAIHAYAADIDLFGEASLFQYVNRCSTEQGRTLLAANLLRPQPISIVKERNNAVVELSAKINWRQEFQALAMQQPITLNTEYKITDWLQTDDAAYAQNSWKYILPAYAAITVSSAIAALMDYIPGPVFSFIFLIYIIIGMSFSKKAVVAYKYLSGIVKPIDTLSNLVQHIEGHSFQGSHLKGLQNKLRSINGNTYSQIKELKDILNRFDLRLNVFVFIILNSFFLWDVWQMRSLNTWKANNKAVLPEAFAIIAEFEVVNSLSALHFNEPKWAFPAFEDFFALHGDNIGHPLLPASKRVTSDFVLNGTGKVALITGSNMAGKSTFLRSLAVNIVLAQIGAPVCASSFTLSSMDVMSSMRIADNLAENTSTFYAELKKLESIIKAVKEHRPLFVLLDEILRGTNSLDRHIGSKALIRQLIKEQAVAIIATHDVELTQLSEEYPSALDNYHFDVQVENDELFFDYKLKDGVCQSLNASLLMKKIGIEL